MNNISIKQLFVIFGTVTVIVVLFIVGVNLFLRWGVSIEDIKKELPKIELPKIEKDAVRKAPAEIKYADPSEVQLTPSVIYDGKSFIPKRVIRDGSGSIGCVVIVVNRSTRPLTIGMSPHYPTKDVGPVYEPIASENKLIFDPRFVGIKEITFHNHEIPSHEFTVELGPVCQI